jgi:ribosomal protein S27AE
MFLILILAVLGIAGFREMFNVGYPACPRCGSKQRFRWNHDKTRWICQKCGSHGEGSQVW